MTMASQQRKIDDLMDKVSESLIRTAYFEAERMATKAMGMARQENDFERMARIVMPLLEARRQRLQQALTVKKVVVLDQEITEEMKIKPGCYLVQPPLVGGEWVTGDAETLAAFVLSGGFDTNLLDRKGAAAFLAAVEPAQGARP